MRSETTLPIKWTAAQVRIGTAKGAKSVLQHRAQSQDQHKTAGALEPCGQVEFQSAVLIKSCFRRFLVGSSPYMTAIADSKHRVTLRQARPGDRFDVEILEEGKYVLTRLEPTKPQPSRVRLEKRNGYTVGVSDQPVSEQAIRDAVNEFP